MVRLAAALETGTRVISLDLLLLTGHDLRFGPPSCSEGDHSCLALASTVVGCHLHFVQASRVKPGQGEAVLVGWNARNGPVVRGVRDLLTMLHYVVQDGCPAAPLMARPPHQLIGVRLGGPG